jgi:tetratricopeptide (TPR) repeat protein
MRRLLVGCLWGLLSAVCIAAHAAPQSKEIDRAIIHLELDRATALSFQEPEPQFKWYYQARILFVRYLIHEDAQLLSAFLDHCKGALEVIQALPESDPLKDMMAAELFFLRGAVKAMDKKTVASALEIKSACTLIYRNSQVFPQNKEQLKLLGVFNVAMSAIPKKLKWLSNVLCFNGNLNLGIKQLEIAARESRLLPQEASLLLFYFEKNMLSKPEAAVARALKMVEAEPNSKVANYLLLTGYLETRQIDKAIALVEAKEAILNANAQADKLPVWYYTRAKAHFFRLEYAQCIQQMDRFLSLYHGKTLYADALYKKAMSLVLMGRYEASKPVFLQLTKVESSSFDVDEYALSQASIYLLHEPSRVEQELYAARNLFDGGYYLRSLRLLVPIQEQQAQCTENERCELWYRLGRNWQEMDSTRLAKGSFVACFATQPGRNLWMKAYAHYYLGQLEEKQKNYPVARREYQIALSYDNYDYQAGLEQRCKAAIEQLKGRN